MALRIVENSEDYLPKLKKYFSCYLRGRIGYQHNQLKTNKQLFETEIHFYNRGAENSIYYFEYEDQFFFGLGKEIAGFANMSAVTRFSSHLNYNLKVKKEAIMFAKENSKVFFVMPINCDSLSDIEYASLIDKNHIINIDGRYYIKFGELKRGIEILKYLRNFMNHISVDKEETDYLKVTSVSILYKFKKDPSFCKDCGNLISGSFEKNPTLRKIAGNDLKFCANCFSKRLMDYFLSVVPIEFRKKRNLELLSNKYKIIKFYLDLFKQYNIFNEDGELPKDLGNYNFTPRKKRINLSEFKLIIITLDVINELIVMDKDSNKISPFEEELFKNNLSYDDGVEIKDKLELEVFSGSLMFYKYKRILKKRIKSRIADYIGEMTSECIDIFKITNELNNLTLDMEGCLNDSFINELETYGFEESVGWEIREILIDNAFEGLIEEDHILTQFNNTITEFMGKKLRDLFTKKEYYVMGNKMHIITICNQDEILKSVKILNLLKKYFSIDNFILYKVDYGFFKIVFDVDIEWDDLDAIRSILNRNMFEEFTFDCNNMGD